VRLAGTPMGGDSSSELVIRGRRDRRVYLGGPLKGQRRPSRKTSRRLRGDALAEQRRSEWGALETLADELEREELEKACGDMAPGQKFFQYRLGRGCRERWDSATQYAVGVAEEADAEGLLVVAREEDVLSGLRWFHEVYPSRWMEKYTKHEREKLAERSSADYGKQFVEASTGGKKSRRSGDEMKKGTK
jgi:hypothetical protein